MDEIYIFDNIVEFLELVSFGINVIWFLVMWNNKYFIF